MLISRESYDWNNVLSSNYWAYQLGGRINGRPGLITGILRYVTRNLRILFLNKKCAKSSLRPRFTGTRNAPARERERSPMNF